MSCLYNAVFVHEISFWVIDRVIHKCNAGCDSCFTSLYSRFRRCPKRNIVLVGQLCVVCRGYFGGENCISNEYRPTNLLTCSTDMGLLRLCKISEMPQLGWECPGVSYWFWQNFKKEKKEKKRESGGGRERERGETERKGGGENKTKTKQKKNQNTDLLLNSLSKLWCPIFSPSQVPI